MLAALSFACAYSTPRPHLMPKRAVRTALATVRCQGAFELVKAAAAAGDIGSGGIQWWPRRPSSWDFVDSVFLITCPSADGSNERLQRAQEVLTSVGLGNCVEVREFDRDDTDRVRGCYTSHIAVLQEVEQLARKRSGAFNALVIEDNVALSPRISKETLDGVASFLREDSADMVHLAYIMYVPGLSVERVDERPSLVRLECNADSVLGTTAYLITRRGVEAVMAEHRRAGYVDAVPNMMARLFPRTRYAAYPMVFHRAANIKSLVNGQLDNLRAPIFLPEVWPRIRLRRRAAATTP